MDKYLHAGLTQKINGAFYKVYNKMGYGFMEKVYENCLIIELRKIGLKCEQQYPIKVYYGNEIVGEYIADILVENKVILELKAVNHLLPIHEVQLVNYLRATDVEVGLLLNFGREPIHKRKVFTNDYKTRR